MMSTQRLNRWSGLAALFGGALWIASAIVMAAKPEGCVASECDLPGRSMRESGTLVAVLVLPAVLLVAVGVAGLVRRARTARSFRREGRVGLAFGGVGFAAIVAGGLVQAVFFGDDFPYMPLFVIPGVLALVVGLVLVGIAVLRARVLARPAAVLLIAGALAMLGFNDQDARVLLAVPLGLGWTAVGYALWSDKDAPRVPAGSTGTPLPARPS